VRTFRFEGGGPIDGDRDLPYDLGTQPPMLMNVVDGEPVEDTQPTWESTGYWLRWVPADDGTPRYLWSEGYPSAQRAT
jgi:hypothetical protein